MALFLTGAAIATGGCGSTQTLDPVERAADVTAQRPGYHISATMNVTTPVLGRLRMRMTGVYDSPTRSGTMSAAESVGGRRLQFTEVFSGLTFYMRATGLPQVSRLTGGKPWLKFDMSRMLGAMGVGALPTGTDPSQFVDYLRAVSSSDTRTGTAVLHGLSTTAYHAVIDLDRYVKLVPSSQRASAQRAVKTLELALGSHTMPIDVWIDRGDLVRRLELLFSECVSGQRIQFGMTMDLYDYGPQSQPSLPKADEASDITPYMASSLGRLKFGCSSG